MSKKSKNPVSLLISELEEMSGGKVLFTERLEDPLPSSPTMDWLLSKEHILFSRPVGTLAFQVKLIRTTLLDVEQAWTSVCLPPRSRLLRSVFKLMKLGHLEFVC